MLSCLRASVIDALQAVAPDGITPAAELLILKCLPSPSEIQQSGGSNAAGSVLDLLLNVTHQSREISKCCATPTPLNFLARSLHSAFWTLRKGGDAATSDGGHPHLVTYVAQLLCLLINMVEHDADAAVRLADMDMATAVLPVKCTVQGNSGSVHSCKNKASPDESEMVDQSHSKHSSPSTHSSESAQELAAEAGYHKDMFDDFRTRKEDILSTPPRQVAVPHNRRLRRSGPARPRASSTSSAGGKPRFKSRNSSATVPSSSAVTEVRLPLEPAWGCLWWHQFRQHV
jgi:hypothetical protein